jgi:hypothetical protein
LILTDTHINRENIRIGQRYEILLNSTQTPYLKTTTSKLPTLKIEVSIESPWNRERFSQENQNTTLLLKCVTLINLLFAIAPEGLEEASEALETMLHYYSDYSSDLGQTSLPQELGIIKGKVLPTQVRPPLSLDFD